MDPPKDPLQDRCRVCGGKLSRYEVSYDCHTNKARLTLIGVSIADEFTHRDSVTDVIMSAKKWNKLFKREKTIQLGLPSGVRGE